MATTDGTGASISEARDDRVTQASGLLDDAVELTHELRAALHDQLRLVSNEAQLAARSLTTIVAAAIGIGGLLVSAWLGLMAVGTYALIDLGLEPVVAMLIGATLNLIALLVPVGMIRRKRRNLGFPATLRTLQPASSRSGERRAA
jgi:hypothetical protein